MQLWVVAAVGVVALALVGLGAWALADRSSGGSATQDATTLIDNVDAAWNSGKGIPAVYASDAVIRSLGDTYVGVKAISQAAAIPASGTGFHVERVAPVTVNGDFATTLVRITGVGIDETPVVAVFQLKDGKVLRHWGFGMGMTKPFDNAVLP